MYRKLPIYKKMERSGELDFYSYGEDGKRLGERKSIQMWIDNFV